MKVIEFNKIITIILEEKDLNFLDCMCGKNAQFIICDFKKTEELDKFLMPYVHDGNLETGKLIYLK